MKNEQIKRQLDDEFSKRHMQHELKEKELMLDYAQHDDMLREALEDRRGLLSEALRRVGRGTSSDLSAQMRELNKRIDVRLQALGMRLDHVYACPLCRDSGYTRVEPPVRCACFERAYRERLMEDIVATLGDESFECFNPSLPPDKPVSQGGTQRKALAKYRDVMESYANHFPLVDKKVMVMYGNSGLGKTFLLNATARRVRERGFDVTVISAPRMLETLRAAMMNDEPAPADELFQTPLLLVDDLGMEPMMNKITVEQIFLLFDERLRANRPIIISTNLPPLDIKARYGERIASRVTDSRSSVILYFEGDDLRTYRQR